MTHDHMAIISLCCFYCALCVCAGEQTEHVCTMSVGSGVHLGLRSQWGGQPCHFWFEHIWLECLR